MCQYRLTHGQLDCQQVFGRSIGPIALYPFQEGRKTGYIDETGKVRLKPTFDAAGPFVHGIAQASGHNEHVFIDEKGKVRFRVPLPSHHGSFGPDGLAYFARWDAKAERQRAAFRDRDGKELALPLDDASTPSEGLAAARKHRGDETTWMGSSEYPSQWDPTTAPWGYVDLKGKLVIDEQFDRACTFSGERAAVSRKKKWGFIDRKGATVVPFRYDQVTSFEDGFASVASGGAWSVIDPKGKVVLATKLRAPLAFRDGLSPGCIAPNEWAIVDLKGKPIGKERFLELFPFSGAAAPARDAKTKKWGLVDRAGKWIKPPKMESMRRFVGALAHYTLRYSRNVGKSRYGYLNAAGEIVYEYTQ